GPVPPRRPRGLLPRAGPARSAGGSARRAPRGAFLLPQRPRVPAVRLPPRAGGRPPVEDGHRHDGPFARGPLPAARRAARRVYLVPPGAMAAARERDQTPAPRPRPAPPSRGPGASTEARVRGAGAAVAGTRAPGCRRRPAAGWRQPRRATGGRAGGAGLRRRSGRLRGQPRSGGLVSAHARALLAGTGRRELTAPRPPATDRPTAGGRRPASGGRPLTRRTRLRPASAPPGPAGPAAPATGAGARPPVPAPGRRAPGPAVRLRP